MYAMSVVNGGSPFCLCSTTWWATIAVSGSEKVLCVLVCCSVGSACVLVCVCVCVCVYAVITGISFYFDAIAICHIALASLEGERSLFFSSGVGMDEIRCVEFRLLI